LYLSSERNHVVLAKREDINILDNHQLIMVLVEDGAIHQVPHILLVTLGEVKHSFGISHWGFAETLPFWIFSNAFQDRSDSSRELVKSFLGLFFGRFLALSGSGAWGTWLIAELKICSRFEEYDLQGQLRPSKSMGGFKV
jgi:hypothetical protein